MKLIMSPLSPYVRKVRVLVREANITDAVEEVVVATTPLETAAEVRAANPLGKIPALVRTDGPTLFDSRVICRFLDDFAGAGLYPASRLWEVLTLEALAEGITDAAISMAYEVRMRPEAERSPAWIEAQWQKAARGIAAVEDQWMSHLSGPLNMGQIGVACALSYIDLRHDARNWREGHKALADWHAAFCARPALQATRPEPAV